ncbi:MAG: sel1 repeat family protein [Thermoguttaceae bacterium]|nr:sel1 repeat family protein [Thermoguttaceae bacterium]
MDLLTPEQLATFAKKYNRFIILFPLNIFFNVLFFITSLNQGQGYNQTLFFLYWGLLFLALSLTIYVLVLVSGIGKTSLEPKIKEYSDRIVLFTIALNILPFTPYPFRNITNIIGLILLYNYFFFLVYCTIHCKVQHPNLSLGAWLMRILGLIIYIIILVVLGFGYNKFVKALPQTVTFDMVLVEAQNGNPEAQNVVGNAYLEGNYSGEAVEKNPESAFSWFQKAAENGNAYGMLNLAVCYRDGIGTTANHEEAGRYLRLAAEQNIPEAQFLLGDYLLLLETEASQIEAVQWYQKAMDQNFPPAIYSLGVCLTRGLGIPQDEEMGKALIQKAADMGYTPQ